VTRLAPPEYKALHAIGTAPVITDGKLVLGELGAIIEYIIAKYGRRVARVGAGSPGVRHLPGRWWHAGLSRRRSTGCYSICRSGSSARGNSLISRSAKPITSRAASSRRRHHDRLQPDDDVRG
jgi:hypothetical protein